MCGRSRFWEWTGGLGNWGTGDGGFLMETGGRWTSAETGMGAEGEVHYDRRSEGTFDRGSSWTIWLGKRWGGKCEGGDGPGSHTGPG